MYPLRNPLLGGRELWSRIFAESCRHLLQALSSKAAFPTSTLSTRSTDIFPVLSGFERETLDRCHPSSLYQRSFFSSFSPQSKFCYVLRS